MKVLFEFSRSGLPKYRKYLEIIRDQIIENGHTLVNDLLKETNQLGSDKLPEEIFSKITKSISQAQCVIIEASEVSLSQGYILTKAISLGKPVILLKHKESNIKKSRFADTIKSKLLKNETYSDKKSLTSILNHFWHQNKYIKTRFNLVLPNELDSYITQTSLSMDMSKTEYITKLIKDDRKTKSVN